MAETGINHVTTIPHTPQMNGIAERVNRTLVDNVITILHDSGLPQYMWGEAAHFVMAVKNMSPHAGTGNNIPARLWSGRMPSSLALHPFGCQAIARDTNPSRKKLDARAKDLVFVGYDLRTKAWRLWDANAQAPRSNIILSRDVKFFDSRFVKRSSALSIHSIIPYIVDPLYFLILASFFYLPPILSHFLDLDA